MNIMVIIVACASFSLSFTSYDFCDKECHANDGVVCTETDNCIPHQRCRNLTKVGLSKLEKLVILSEINDFRRLVANGFFNMTASNMRTLIWNNDLEESAQCWSLQCDIIYDICTETLNSVPYGQSINLLTKSHLMYGLITTKQIAIDQWWSEQQKLEVKSTLIDSYSSNPEAKNFTQLLWAETHMIGCGLTMFEQDEGVLAHFLVCNFEPKGNILGKPIFKRGVPCSACPNFTICNEEVPGLCRDDVISLRRRGPLARNSNHLLNEPNLKINAVFLAMVFVYRRMERRWF